MVRNKEDMKIYEEIAKDFFTGCKNRIGVLVNKYGTYITYTPYIGVVREFELNTTQIHSINWVGLFGLDTATKINAYEVLYLGREDM